MSLYIVRHSLTKLLTALRVSLFLNATTRGSRSWRSDASLVAQWECLGRIRTSSYSATMVSSAFVIGQQLLIQWLVEFGLYVDRHGDPSRSIQTIEWEGTAEHVAWHPPYVLLFDSRFIEIRHVETGRLAQIIPGNDMRCIWDGRGTSVVPPATPGLEGWNEGVSQEPRVHGVMNGPEPPLVVGQPRAARPVAQHVFELIPTIPLFLPGSLASPSQSTYFAQSNSPPHSPQLNPTHSWRS